MSTLLASLGIVCPSCNLLNTAGARGCSGCQASLLDVSASARTARPGATPLPTALPLTAPVTALPVTARPAARPVAAPRPAPRSVPAPQVAAEPAKTGRAPSGAGMPPAAVRAPGPAAQPARVPASPMPLAARTTIPANVPLPANEGAKKAPAPKPPAAGAAGRFGLVVVSGPSQGQRFKLPSAGVSLGKSRGAILFPEDPYVSPQHATLAMKEGRLFIRDNGSVSGVFVTISGQETISTAAYFLAGAHLFRYAGAIEPASPSIPGQVTAYGAPLPPGQVMYRIAEILVGGREGLAFVSAGPTVTIGQTQCDLAFPQDEALAARHCELSPTPVGAMIRDLSGGLGTFVRIAPGTERQLKPGDRVRVGEQVLQVEMLSA